LAYAHRYHNDLLTFLFFLPKSSINTKEILPLRKAFDAYISFT
jgi:hypothetical protein